MNLLVGAFLALLGIGMSALGCFMIKAAWRDRSSYRFWPFELAAGWLLNGVGGALFLWVVAAPR